MKSKEWERFKTFKERGEWVELLFMAAASLHGYHVLKPWGESFEYDVAIEHGGGLTRVQVKSSSVRNGAGYVCQFLRNHETESPYGLKEVDIFAAYVIPVATWYLIPAAVILKPTPKSGLTFYPIASLRSDRCRYERFREAWGLLGKGSGELARIARHH